MIASPGAGFPERQLDVAVSTQSTLPMSATSVATYPTTSPAPPRMVSPIGACDDVVQVSGTRGSSTASGGRGRCTDTNEQPETNMTSDAASSLRITVARLPKVVMLPPAPESLLSDKMRGTRTVKGDGGPSRSGYRASFTTSPRNATPATTFPAPHMYSVSLDVTMFL